MTKERVLSGMRPTGKLHLGNYLGALKNWKEMQETYDCFFFVADWHALTTEYASTSDIRTYIHEMLIDWLAVGIDPEKATIFVQSMVPDHAVLHLLLSMITPLPWLERCPTYKEQQQQLTEKDLSTFGFLGYPVLQAADILIYKAHKVPVGIDQVPHLELTREIGRRFNHLYGEVFPDPQAILAEIPKLPGTDGRKMSKSYDNCIYLSDSEEVIRNKVRNMMTDPQRKRRQDTGDPDVSPVFAYHKIFSSREEVERIAHECRTAGIGCVDCKKILAGNMIRKLSPIHEKRAAVAADKKRIIEIVEQGTASAARAASQTMAQVREAMKISF
ncbi:MAG: tryptophan--tRNA ligase [Nitrospirae bacterium CG_4_9_14_3_um_filter_53_35]|nr:MAG: tryptophan--tRNA ligase [Nitrospirae bacterium CG2_30_53_67]PIS38332.1 MAG: tryptophan--tRNA ligase [Nitrospirae bacterium CG08_land_8_20_14_0_20_52_24]PIV85492.1 MAG: tryptophan--tRNA ligase [Nitrospirae bacterium CG17_big_fil_post_rev_8_21_14_2_50_50_9]PIW85205.1 MAG: tryptophan--tRNA ligase [Nitrospirae bacterium CG_4_8_14_3_um_filter_50_41]PIX84525.1 MAG: tryptophan--tRNA ligase [Nitrospirae bacterium CG_4_10_14_3_um_filter_53_41]PJA76766.1 MAG: tryptophan--tRNA ligase [Nitrospirae